MRHIPEKLSPDAVVEALLEVRFTSEEVPELAIGRLAAGASFKGFEVQRLPVSNIPAVVRNADPNLQHQPTIELRSHATARVARVGERVFSWHTLPPYPGWETFRAEIHDLTKFVFTGLSGFRATRLGLKYVNILSPEKHGISGVRDLNLSIAISNSSLDVPVNLNYMRSADLHTALVRVASAEFIEGPSQPISALIDIDVFTSNDYNAAEADSALQWIEDAHTLLKREFFALLPDNVLATLERK